MRRAAMIVGAVLGVVIATIVTSAWLSGTGAHGGADAQSFTVAWHAQDTDAPCTRVAMLSDVIDRGGATGFTQVITVRDAAGDIVQMVPLVGAPTERHPDICTIDVSVDAIDGPGVTLWHEDRYLAAIPAGTTIAPDAGIQLVD